VNSRSFLEDIIFSNFLRVNNWFLIDLTTSTLPKARTLIDLKIQFH